MTDDLKFPKEWANHPPPPKVTMEQYLHFVMQMRRYFPPKKKVERPMPVNVRFRLD